ncbi:MAG: tetratricopeptide repeat protein [Bacteroidetes bacterium]|nr:MAG: tetratricopeptide repeat protein [Bacteroidota bacterium]
MKTNLLLGVILFLLPGTLSAQERGVTPSNHQTIQPSNHPATTYAVVVGISNYQDEGIPDLRFADKDAEAFANFLRSPAGGALDGDHLRMLVNSEATGAQIVNALDWLLEVVHEQDKVIIYFSGHGDVEAKRISQPGYLLGWDAPPRAYAAGGTMNVRDFQDYITTLAVQNKAQVVVITDACHSGKLSGSDVNGAQLTGQNLARKFANELKILSCQPDEYSIEGEQWGGGRGAFSYHLIDGLYGLADGNNDLSINLREIRNYLEEHVSSEVAPHSQTPMIVGSGNEELAAVLPEILEQIREGRKGQLQLFTPTESRGIEEKILASVDTAVQGLYAAFQKALEKKQFLKPEKACADAYYEQLIREPALEPLYSSMRRNYAAALQDDAQQFLNHMLNGGLTEKTLKGTTTSYAHYPEYLEKAAGLLGTDHYMYPVLQARKYFLIGYISNDARKKKESFQRALELQPDMPHAYAYLIQSYTKDPDSARYYFNKATEIAPKWIYPYILLGNQYSSLGKWDNAEKVYLQGMALDSATQHVKYWLALCYFFQNKYDLAEPLFKEVIESLSPDLSHPLVNGYLGLLYMQTGRFDLAEKQFKKAIQLDPTDPEYHLNLGWLYFITDRLEEAEREFQYLLSKDTYFRFANNNLGLLYAKTGNYTESEKYLSKAKELSPESGENYIYHAVLYSTQHQIDKAFEYLELGFQYGWNYPPFDIDINEYPALAPLREQTARWNTLLKKYFPDEFKD